MAIYKNKDLEVDISFGTSKQINKSASFYTGDKGSTSIRITVKHKGFLFNFAESDMIPTLDLIHSDGSIWLSEPMTVVDGGTIQYNIPDNIIEHAGTINAKLFLKDDTTSVHALNFNIEILDSGINDLVEKEVSLVLVEDTVRNIMTENALGLIDETFKTEVLDAFQDYTIANPELFKGDKGDKGEQGVRGPIGETGAIGLTGAKGDKGDKGDTGAQGVQGVAGAKGEKGDQGVQGIPGIDGADGEDGISVSAEEVLSDIATENNKISFDKVHLDTMLNSKVPLQSFIYTDEFIYAMRVEPTLTRTEEDLTIMQFSKSGTYMSSMKALGAGHNESIGYKDGRFYIVLFSESGAEKALYHFPYTKDATVSYETTQNSNFVKVNISMQSIDKVNVSIYKDILSLSYYKGVTTGLNLRQYDLNTLNQINDIDMATDVSLNWLQGVAISDDKTYLSIGSYSVGDAKEIRVYSNIDGSVTDVIDVSRIGADDVGASATLDWLEPEGLQIIQDGDKDILLHGVFTGGNSTGPTQKRYKIYRWDKVIQNNADLLSFYNHSDSMIYDGGSIQGNSTQTYSMIETAKNYKFLTVYYTAGVAGTHCVTVPTDLLKLVKYVDCECRAITANGELFNYITRITFDNDLKKFSITTSRMLKVNIDTPTSSSTTRDNYAGFYLYKIKGHQMYSEFGLD